MEQSKKDKVKAAGVIFGISDLEIKSGMVVRYDGGWYRVTKATKNVVNLGSVFGGHIHHKNIPKDQVKEDEKAWYEAWSQSETYKCM